VPEATARWLGEDALARYFDVPAIARFVKGVRLYKYGRAGYVFQQLAKLLTPLVVAGMADNVLILDSDVVFLKDVHFLDEDAATGLTVALQDTDDHFHENYFSHLHRLLPGVHRALSTHSGVVHHMLFQRSKLKELVAEAVAAHGGPSSAAGDGGDADGGDGFDPNIARFWRLWIEAMQLPPVTERNKFSRCSEYEVYLNWMLMRHPGEIRLRNLVSINTGRNRIKKLKASGRYDWAAFHSYLVKQEEQQEEQLDNPEQGCSASGECLIEGTLDFI